MTWGAQRGSGRPVTDIDRGAQETGYQGLRTDAAGRMHPRQRRDEEQLFGPDGTPYITPGMTAVVEDRIGPFRIHRRVRVIYVIDEPGRSGFAIGTIGSSWTVGEQQYSVVHRDDDSVYAVTRAFHGVLRWHLKPFAPLLLSWQKRSVIAQLRALLPALGGGRVIPEDAPAEDESADGDAPAEGTEAPPASGTASEG